MTKTTAIDTTPSPTGGEHHTAKTDGHQADPKGQFFGAALTMSWQLAIAVLVPVIGGFQLDKALDTVPALTIVGFFLAMLGTGVVMWRTLQVVSPSATKQEKHP